MHQPNAARLGSEPSVQDFAALRPSRSTWEPPWASMVLGFNYNQPFSAIVSAICTALSAAPLRILSATTHMAKPLG